MRLMDQCIVRGLGLDRAVIRAGKQALEANCSQALDAADGWRFDASVDLDGALQNAHANENRWDYGLELAGPAGKRRLEWVEFHPACSSDVARVIKKKEWLERLLANKPACPRLDSRNLHWVATGGVHIDMARGRMLAQAGLRMPQKRLRLPLA